ncbi:DUF6114 domain-containing protein, partial [Streptomyces massasporeus]
MTVDPPPEPAPGPEAPVPPGSAGPVPRSRGARAAFRRWRRTRPFWATVWTALGGFVIFFLPMAPLGKILQVGVGGIAGMAGGVVLMAMALLMLLLPGQRHTAGVIAVIAGVASPAVLASSPFRTLVMKSLIGFGAVSTFAQPGVTGVTLPEAEEAAMASAKEPAAGLNCAASVFGSSAPSVAVAYFVMYSLPAASASHSFARSLFWERSVRIGGHTP